jgi:hypothetical protein
MAACAGPNEKDQYNLFHPTPADKMRNFSTDRPPSTSQPDRHGTNIGLVPAAIPYRIYMGIAQRF